MRSRQASVLEWNSKLLGSPASSGSEGDPRPSGPASEELLVRGCHGERELPPRTSYAGKGMIFPRCAELAGRSWGATTPLADGGNIAEFTRLPDSPGLWDQAMRSLGWLPFLSLPLLAIDRKSVV